MRLQLLRSIICGCFSIRRREPIIFRMPMELLLNVFSLLELPSQVCLAMSCKGLYQLFGSVLQADDLCFPRLSSRKGRYSQTKEYCSRMTLLVQLEYSRWACCAACQKLHPRKEFSLFYMSEYPSPRQRACKAWAGLVDLCPCITLTPRDKRRIMKYLGGKGSDKKTINVVNRGVLKPSHNDEGEQCVSHKCRGYSMAKVDMMLSLSDDGQLVVCTQYEAPLTALRMESIYICAHSTLRHCMFGKSSLSPGAIWNCVCCHTCLVNLTKPRTPEVIVAAVTRYLGRATWPKAGLHEDWIYQSRYWSDYMA